MRRPPPGTYVEVAAAGERFRAFVPAPLPPEPPVVWSSGLRRRFDDALLALGRLDALAAHLPNAALVLYSFVRKEAVLSSQIEGTQSSLADLLLFEIDEQPGVPIADAREVSRCVAALEHGLELLRGGLPLSMRLLRSTPRARLGFISQSSRASTRRMPIWGTQEATLIEYSNGPSGNCSRYR